MKAPPPELPHSPEAEQGVLGCILLDAKTLPHCRQMFGRHQVFYDLRHQTIFEAMATLCREAIAVDLITVQKRLRESKQLDEVGGIAFLSSLLDSVPSAANLDYYLGIVIEQFQRRRIIQLCSEAAERAMTFDGKFEDLLWATRSDLADVLDDGRAREEVWQWDELTSFDFSHDPSAVIGIRDGTTTRFLCRGYGAWLIGQSGSGKSSIVMQWATCLASGRPLWGIAGVRPLKVGIIQAENDRGDAAEFAQGISQSLNIDELDPELHDLVRRNIWVITERQSMAEEFCSFLERMIVKYGLEVVFIDPLLSFAGVDVSRQTECTKFLRKHLNPVLVRTGCVLIGAHHTGKPKLDKGIKQPTALDYAYAGIGSSELVNWARAVLVLLSLGDGVNYELKLAKRGRRAGATHPDKSPAPDSIFLRHAADRIFWEQVSPPEEQENHNECDAPAELTKPEIIANLASSTASDRSGFLAGCKPDGETPTDIRKRLCNWLMTDGNPNLNPKIKKRFTHKDGTIRDAIDAIEVAKLIQFRDEKYYRA